VSPASFPDRAEPLVEQGIKAERCRHSRSCPQQASQLGPLLSESQAALADGKVLGRFTGNGIRVISLVDHAPDSIAAVHDSFFS
jgi:hypothetical protein